jgi:hypothetical protein
MSTTSLATGSQLVSIVIQLLVVVVDVDDLVDLTLDRHPSID